MQFNREAIPLVLDEVLYIMYLAFYEGRSLKQISTIVERSPKLLKKKLHMLHR